MADQAGGGDCGCTEATIGGLLGVGLYGVALWQGWLLPGAGPAAAISAGFGALIVAGLIGKAVGLALVRRRRQAAGRRFA